MTHPTPDFRVVDLDRGRGQDVSGIWFNGRYECSCECTYTTCCQELWLTVEAVTTNGIEWQFVKTELNQIDFEFCGEKVSVNPYRTYYNGKEFFREEVIEAMTRCYERDREYQRETA